MRTVLFAFLLGLFCRDVLALPDTEPSEIVRSAIIEKLLDGCDTKLKQETPVDVAFVREIAPGRLGSNIVNSASKIAGMVFEFESSGHDKHRYLSRVVVWVFSYNDNKSALRNAKSIKSFCKDVGCFKSKILTIFSYTVVANKVVVIFTENSGNESVVAFVDSAPKLFSE